MQQWIDKATGMVTYRRLAAEAERRDVEGERSLARFDTEVRRVEDAAARVSAIGRLLE